MLHVEVFWMGMRHKSNQTTPIEKDVGDHPYLSRQERMQLSFCKATSIREKGQ